MKLPKSFSLITILFIVIGFTELAQAFYNPETGSFLSRDPIEERGGENLYGFVRNDGIGRIDILGLDGRDIIVDHDKTDPCPTCPCVGSGHDCSIQIRWLHKGDTLVINNWIDPNQDGLQTGKTVRIPITDEAESWLVPGEGGGRLFREYAHAVIELKSASGKDLSGCHLAQDAQSWWKIIGDVDIKTGGLKIGDYNSKGWSQKVNYGGSWFYDGPGNNRADAEWHFFLGMVYVEENTNLKGYWAWGARADYSRKGSGPNGQHLPGDASAERKQFPKDDGNLVGEAPVNPFN